MSESSRPQPKKVLLVDGDFRTAQRLADLLRDDGFEVDVARDGSTAIARLARAPLPDALVSELKLPLADGAAVARFGRAQHSGLEVVFVTRDPNLLAPGLLTSAPPHVLTKPLDYARLLEVLRGPVTPEESGAVASPAGGAR
ncbi:MAG TPA: response regulator [Polyangiaceae bacterium]|nr:response regulator [Polyangiaceae bacterium]